MLRKVVSMVITSSMVLSVSVVPHAASEQWGFEDFSSSSLGANWEVTGSDGNVARLNTENQNFELNKIADSGGVRLAYVIPDEIKSGQFTVEFAFYMDGIDGKEVQIKGDNKSGQNIFLYRLAQNDRPAIRNEDSGYTNVSDEIVTKGDKITFKSIIDFDAAKENITTFINSQEASAKKGFQVNVSEIDLKKISFYIPTASSYTGVGIVIDDFKLYAVGSDAESVLASHTALDLGDTSNLTDNLALSWSDDDNGTAIEWSSSNPDVITDSGEITRSYFNDETAVLTARIHKNDVSVSKKFNITVLKSDETLTDEELVQRTKDWLDLGDTSAVTQDITLPVHNATYGTDISWKSDNDKIISDSGVVTRPLADTEVNLTATISRGDASDTKEFKLYVIRNIPKTSDAESVLSDAGFIIEKPAGQEGSSMSVARNMTEDAKNIVTASFDYTLNGEKNKAMNLYIRGAKTDGSQFETTIQFVCGGYVGLRNQDAVTGKVVYERLSDKTENDGKHNIKLSYNTLFPGLEVWVDDEKCDTGTYIPEGIYSINSLTWYIPTAVSGIKMQVDNIKAEHRRSFEDCINKDIETLDLGELDGIKEDLKLPDIGEYSSFIT